MNDETQDQHDDTAEDYHHPPTTGGRGPYRRQSESASRRRDGQAEPYGKIVRALDAFMKDRGIASNVGTWSALKDTQGKPHVTQHATPHLDGGRDTGPKWVSKWVRRHAGEPGRISLPKSKFELLRAIALDARARGLVWDSTDELAVGYRKPDRVQNATYNRS